jgi:hypothetical protein
MAKLTACVCVIVASFLHSGSVQQQRENSNTMPVREECPDTHGWKGKYDNFSFGFSFVIPEGFEGFWNSAACANDKSDGSCVCMNDHGRIIPLSAEPYEPERHIEVFAGHGGDFDGATVAQAIAQHLRWTRKRALRHRLIVRKRLGVTVDGVRGERVIVRYYDKRLKNWFLEDLVELFKDGDEFSLYLRTPRTSYKHDKAIFDAVVASFVFKAREANKTQK